MIKKRIARHYRPYIAMIAAGILFGSGFGIFLGLSNDLPQIQALENFKPSAITRVYSADNALLAEIYAEKRDIVPIQIIPEYLKLGLITTEDRNFYSHSGIDIKGILRALLHDIRARRFVEGASTITQQLAKTLFLTPQKSIVRKIKEAILSLQLERRYTKDELLEFYLNQIYFGSGAYGVESASRIYFGKSVKDLTLHECALIAGIPKAPSFYSPLINKDRALARRNLVLKQMMLTGIISPDQYDKTISEPLVVIEKFDSLVKAPYFIEHIKKVLDRRIGSDLLYKDGLSIYTTLSSALQKSAESSVQKGVDALSKRMKKDKGITDAPPQGALIALDIKTGGIVAMVGGTDYEKYQYNRATVAKRQPGSAFKPIYYALAIEQGFSQNHLLLDTPIAFKGVAQGKEWRPENFSKSFRGEITLRSALTHSENIPSIRLLEMLGPESVVQFSHKLGIQSKLSPNLSLALGTSEITLLELTASYAVFANQGFYIKPYEIVEVVDQRGRILYRTRPQKTIVMSSRTASIMTDILEGVIKEGTARRARSLKRALAGKTGTTNQYKDALFIGYSPKIAAGVWVGTDAYQSIGRKETGAIAALPIWMDFMHDVVKDSTFEHFEYPDTLVRIPMNPNTGKRVSSEDPEGVMALFDRTHPPK